MMPTALELSTHQVVVNIIYITVRCHSVKTGSTLLNWGLQKYVQVIDRERPLADSEHAVLIAQLPVRLQHNWKFLRVQ